MELVACRQQCCGVLLKSVGGVTLPFGLDMLLWRERFVFATASALCCQRLLSRRGSAVDTASTQLLRDDLASDEPPNNPYGIPNICFKLAQYYSSVKSDVSPLLLSLLLLASQLRRSLYQKSSCQPLCQTPLYLRWSRCYSQTQNFQG